MERIKELFGGGALNYEQFCDALKSAPDIKLFDGEEIKRLTALLEAEKAARQADADDFSVQLGQVRRDLMIELALQKAGARNIKAARALLDESGIKLENGALSGAEEQIEAAKESCPYLFGKGAAENPPPPAAGMGQPTTLDEQARWRAEAGLPQKT